MNKKEKYNCYKCKDTGIIKYKDIETSPFLENEKDYYIYFINKEDRYNGHYCLVYRTNSSFIYFNSLGTDN